MDNKLPTKLLIESMESLVSQNRGFTLYPEDASGVLRALKIVRAMDQEVAHLKMRRAEFVSELAKEEGDTESPRFLSGRTLKQSILDGFISEIDRLLPPLEEQLAEGDK